MHRKGRQRETEFQEMPSEEVSRRARDPALSKAERRRYAKEEKCRKRRNKEKRHSD